MKIKETVRRVFPAVGLLLSILSIARAQTPCPDPQPPLTICTIVGGVPNNANPLFVSMSSPSGLAVDSKGNIYIADLFFNVIYELNASTGTLSTIAGNGSSGFSPDGTLAAGAALNQPTAVFVDATGNIFFAEFFNVDTFSFFDQFLIREIDTSGKLHTVAGGGTPPNHDSPYTSAEIGDGGPASSAVLLGSLLLGFPPTLFGSSGIFVDASGNVFIADTGTQRIREVVKSSGRIQTVAGNGMGPGFGSPPFTPQQIGDGNLATNAPLASPVAVSVDRSGNIYILDAGTGLIRVVNVGSSQITVAGVTIKPGTIQTVAGNGMATAPGAIGDDGPAIQTVLGAIPEDLYLDRQNNIYFSDTGNNLIRVVNTGPDPIVIGGTIPNTILPGYIGTVAGCITPPVCGPQGGFNGDGSAIFSELSSPGSVTLDNAGNIYISDSGNHRIRVVNPGTNAVSIAGQTVLGGTISTLVGNGSADLVEDGTGTTNNVLGPTSVSEDANGNIYLAEGGIRVMEAVKSTATIRTVAGNGTQGFSGDGLGALAAQLSSPVGLFLDGSANIFIADSINNRIREINTGNAPLDVGELPIPIQPNDIQTIAGGGEGCAASIMNSSPVGDGCLAMQAPLFQPTDVFVTPVGSIYIADHVEFPLVSGAGLTYAGRIRRVDGITGIIETIAGGGMGCPGQVDSLGDGCLATSAKFVLPLAVFVDGSGNIFITDDAQAGLIRVVNAGTTVITIAGVTIQPGTIQTVAGNLTSQAIGDMGPATSASLAPSGRVFVDQLGDIFIADTGNNRIRVVNGRTVSIPVDTPNGMEQLPPGYIGTVAGNGTPSFSGDAAPAANATLSGPSFIWGDQSGNLLIVDSNNHRIREIAGVLPVPKISLSCLPDDCVSGLTLTDGVSTAASVTVTNTGTAPLVLTSIGLLDAAHASVASMVSNFKIDWASSTCPQPPTTLGINSPQNTCNLAIDLISVGNVPQPATFVITHNAALPTDQSNPAINPAPGHVGQLAQFNQQVSLTRVPVVASISFSPVSVTFTSENAPQTIAIANSGTVPLTTSVGMQGPFVPSTASANPCPTPTTGFTLPGGQSCNLAMSFSGTSSSIACSTGTQGIACGILTITDNAPSSPQTIPLTGFALIPTNGTSFTISNSGPTIANVTLEIIGSTANYAPICVVAPAGLNISCPTTVTGNQTFSAQISVPSCTSASIPNSLPIGGRDPIYVLSALLVLVFGLLRRDGDTNAKRRIDAWLVIPVIYVASIYLVGCQSGIKTPSCVATVNPGTFTVSVTVTPSAPKATLPTLALSPGVSVNVTK